MGRTFTRRQLKRYVRRTLGLSLWDRLRLRFSPVFRSYRRARREAEQERQRMVQGIAFTRRAVSMAYEHAMGQLRDKHRDEFDFLVAKARRRLEMENTE